MTVLSFVVGLGIAIAVLVILALVIKNIKPRKVGEPPREVKEAREEFERAFMRRWPWSMWIVDCGISRRGFIEFPRPDEDPNEWCIVVYLKNPLPEGFALSDSYRGVPLIIKVIGEIKAL